MATGWLMEGTWEEVSQHAGQLAGKRVRLEVIEHPRQPVSEPARPFYATATPEERAQAFITWGMSHTPRGAPPLSDEAISRGSIYGFED